MGWEDEYEEPEWEEEPDEAAQNLEEALSEITNSIIHVDEKVIYSQIGEILKSFYEKFGYSLKPELESKTFIVSDKRGYVAAHLAPAKYNSREKYYTLTYNPDYKKVPEGFLYSLDFTNGFYNSEGGESDAFYMEVLIFANNSQSVVDAIINHWIAEETIK